MPDTTRVGQVPNLVYTTPLANFRNPCRMTIDWMSGSMSLSLTVNFVNFSLMDCDAPS